MSKISRTANRKNNLLKVLAVIVPALALSGCGKIGVSGHIDHMLGNWAPVDPPVGCAAKQIAAEEGASGVVVLCADGRIFR